MEIQAPQHEARLQQSQKFHEEQNPILDHWVEISPDKSHKKGGKVLECKKTIVGVSRVYVGREIHCQDFLKDFKKSAIRIK